MFASDRIWSKRCLGLETLLASQASHPRKVGNSIGMIRRKNIDCQIAWEQCRPNKAAYFSTTCSCCCCLIQTTTTETTSAYLDQLCCFFANSTTTPTKLVSWGRKASWTDQGEPTVDYPRDLFISGKQTRGQHSPASILIAIWWKGFIFIIQIQ